MDLHLKNCPFCGFAESTLWYRETRYGRIAFVSCDVCGARTKAYSYHDEGEEVNECDEGARMAIAAWNRRATNV